MKKSAPTLTGVLVPILALSLALSLAGCFGGEDDSLTNPGKNPKDTARSARLSPGFYVGDYSPYDSIGEWNSEFTLNADGTYRFYWIRTNEAVQDIRGNWTHKDSNLYINAVTETFLNRGIFGPAAPVEDDTNAIRDVTDSSFTRKEWTWIRQKPFWITYRKKDLPKLQAGDYQYVQEIKGDSVTPDKIIRIKMSLAGTDFRYSITEDTLEYFQAEAKWYFIGSLLVTDENRGRDYVDSLKAFGGWDTIPGALVQRLQGVSDTGFQMWSGFLWDDFRKIK